MIPPEINYKNFSLKKINSPQFRHLKLLFFWPIYGMAFSFVERGYTVDSYFVVHCPIDDVIPFCEWFFIPYLFWFVFIIGTLLYTLLFDVDSFKSMMKYIIFTYTVTIIIYLLFPTCQELRPSKLDGSRFLIRNLLRFYSFDTNTNVCPSIHVIGSFAVFFTLCKCKHTIEKPIFKAAMFFITVLICVSTLFIKQHSLIDIAAAMPLCILGYLLFFKKTFKPNIKKTAVL